MLELGLEQNETIQEQNKTIQSEMAVIGIMLMKPEKGEKAFDTLTSKMFLSDKLAAIFNCCKELHEKSIRADCVTVIDKLGEEYKKDIIMCAEMVPAFSGFDSYINCVMDSWRVRKLRTKLAELYSDADDADKITVKLQEILKQQGKIIAHQKGTTNKHFDKCIMEFLKWMEQPDTSIKMGYESIDRVTGGLQRGCVTVITARPGCGKTTLGLQIACNVAINKYNVLYVSLEMTEIQLVRNIVSRFSGISSQKISSKKLNEKEQMEIAKATDYLYTRMKNLVINDTPAQTVNDIETNIKAIRPDVVVIDHIRLLTPLDSRKKEFEASADNTHALKQIAKKYNINIIELVQAKRESEGRVPQMSDLYGGSATEQDADIIIGISPEEEYREMEQCRVTLEVTKNRHGAGGTFELFWERPQCSMCEIVRE